MMTDDEQSVAMISEDTETQDDTETNHSYDCSSDQEAIKDVLCPDLNSGSDEDEDDSLCGTEWLYNLGASDQIVTNMLAMKGKLVTFLVKLFNTDPVSTPFDTGAMCSCISASLYDQISKKVAMIKCI